MAFIHALKIAAELGMGRIVLESDAHNLKTALMEKEVDNGMDAVVIREARLLLFLNFDVFHVMYCPRAYNRVPHELVKFCASMGPGEEMYVA